MSGVKTMNKWIAILAGLLTVQLALALGLNLAVEDHGVFQPRDKLLAFDRKAVDGVRIEDGKDSLELRRRDGKWLLPGNGNFPVEQGAVQRLLDQLAGLEQGWPVATTAGAAERFKVAEGAFERKLTLLAKDRTQAVLYVGTSPGFRKVHVRPAGKDAVYAVAFNTWEANAKADDWIDKDILKLDAAGVTGIELPGVRLQRQGDALKLADLTDQEETDAQQAKALLDKLAGLRIESVLGSEAKPEYRQDEPELEIKLTRKDGEPLSYRFSKPKDAAYYVLKRSDRADYFKLAEYVVDPIKQATRDKLVQAKPTPPPAAAGAAEKPAAAADPAG